MRKTQREIAADHALMSMYCIQIMREFVERGFITQARISVVEEKLNELYAQFSRLLQATGCAFKDAQGAAFAVCISGKSGQAAGGNQIIGIRRGRFLYESIINYIRE
jgi:hypothetical protein